MSTPRPHLLDRVFEGDFMLTLAAYPGPDGRFQPRVVVTALGGTRTRGQRFMDLEWFAHADDALAHARREGIAWAKARP